MTHVYINIIFIIVITSIVIITYTRQLKLEKLSFEIINLLNKNISFLFNLNRKQEIKELQNTIKIGSELQIILKISNADYVSLFKYDFSLEQKLHFIISFDKNGSFVHNTLLDNYVVYDEILQIQKINLVDELSELKIGDPKTSKKIASIMNFRGVNKVYYQNINENKNQPNSFLILSYKDINYQLSDGDKFEIQRIMENVSKIM